MQSDVAAGVAQPVHEHAHGGHYTHGSWGGHVLPGAMFLLWGCWTWGRMCTAWHAAARTKGGPPYMTRTWWPLQLARAPLWLRAAEPLGKVLLPAIGVAVELALHPGDIRFRRFVDPDGSFSKRHLNNYHHAAMYACFCAAGVADLCGARVRFGHVLLVGAFAAEALLFAWHLKMQSGLLADAHVLLIFAVVGCAAAAAADAARRTSFQASALRAFFLLLQGTWFLQLARALYGDHPWDPEDLNAVLALPVVFVWHALAIAGGMAGVFYATGTGAGTGVLAVLVPDGGEDP